MSADRLPPIAPQGADHPLRRMMDDLRALARGDRVRIGTVLETVGERSYAIALLVPAMVVVTPLSGIFGLPTLAALVMILICVQVLMRRRHLWLPGVISNRTLRADRLARAVTWLESPVGWVLRHQRPRLMLLVSPPFRLAMWCAALALSLIIPLMEFLPFTSSVACLAICLMALSMVLRDGLYALAGFAMIGGFGALLWYLVMADGSAV